MRSRSPLPCIGLALLLLAGGAGPRAARAVPAERLAAIDRFLQEHLETSPVPGFSAAVVVGDDVVFAKGYGVTVLGGHGKVTRDSPIGIGSQTKSLTAVAVMQLVEQGELDLDARVVDYLPWFRTADRRGGEITVRMLLYNTSGLPSVDAWLTSSNRSENAAEQRVRELSRVPLVREPGASFEYANENWTILGLLIEQASGLVYSRYMQERVLDPMGMHHSTTALELFAEKRVLYGHYTGIDAARPARPRFLAEALAAGSELRASAGDMGRYLVMLLNDGTIDGRQILLPRSVDLLFTPGVRTSMYLPEMGINGEEAGYAMGWVESEIEGRTLCQHGGDAIVMTSWTMLDRQAKVGASVLYNGPTLDGYRFHTKTWLVHNLLRLVQGLPLSDFGLPQEPDPTANDYELPAELLSRYTGSYVSSGGYRAEIGLDEERQALVLATGSLDLDYVYQLDFASESSVVLRNISGGTRARFLMTPSGKVTGIGGGLFGGLYRRLDEAAFAQLQEARLANGAITVYLPRSWRWREEEGAIVATSDDHAAGEGAPSRLRAGLADGSWSEGRGALAALAGLDVELERTETIGPWVWRQAIGERGEGAARRQVLLASTEVGARRFEIELSTPAGELTAQIREVLLPLFTYLEIEPVH